MFRTLHGIHILLIVNTLRLVCPTLWESGLIAYGASRYGTVQSLILSNGCHDSVLCL